MACLAMRVATVLTTQTVTSKPVFVISKTSVNRAGSESVVITVIMLQVNVFHCLLAFILFASLFNSMHVRQH